LSECTSLDQIESCVVVTTGEPYDKIRVSKEYEVEITHDKMGARTLSRWP